VLLTSSSHTLALHDALPILGADLADLVLLHELQGVAHGVAVQRDLVEGLRVHEVVEISVRVQVLHIHTVNSGCNFMNTEISTTRSEEHTSALQSRFDLVCRL